MAARTSLARASRIRQSLWSSLAGAVVLAVAGCGTPAAVAPEPVPSAEKMAAAAFAPTAVVGTRWSMADLTQLAYAGLGTGEDEAMRGSRRLDELRAEYAPRATAAGAELLWDLGGGNRLGDSPALYIDATLALPAAGPVRVRTIDLVRLADQHARTRAYQAKLLAADAEVQKEADRRHKAVDALVAEYTRLTERGDTVAAAKAAERVAVGQREARAFVQENAEALQRRLGEFFRGLRKDLAAEVVASARIGGVTLVLDVTAPLGTGEPSVIFVAEALSPAADGGLRAGPVPEAVVRTIDREWLYENHPRSLEVHKAVRADNQAATKELAPLKAEVPRLEATLRRLEQSGDRTEVAKTREQLESARAAVQAREKKSRDELSKRLTEHRTAILAEIAKAAAAVAGRTGVHLVLDASTDAAGPRPVAYAAPQVNLTEAVARELGIAAAR